MRDLDRAASGQQIWVTAVTWAAGAALVGALAAGVYFGIGAIETLFTRGHCI